MRLLFLIPSYLFFLIYTSSVAGQDILIENVRIFDGTSTTLTELQNILISNGKIVTIDAGRIKAPENSLKLDGKGNTLMPGLIDAHVHMVQESYPSRKDFIDSALETPNGENIVKNVAPVARADLMQGFTSVRDMGGAVFPVKAAIDAGKIKGPRIWPSGAFVSQTSGHGDYRDSDEKSRLFFGEPSKAEKVGYTFIANGRQEVLTAVRENLRHGASQIKVMASGGLSSAYDPIDVNQYTLDEMKAAVDAASDWGTYVAVHAYTVNAVERAIEAGVKSIEHGHLLDEPTLKLMADKEIWLSFQYLGFGSPKSSTDQESDDPKRIMARAIFDAQKVTWPLAHKLGVKLAWGTDFIFSPDKHKLRNAAILEMQSFLTNAEILKLITHDNAQFLQLSGKRSPYPGELGVIKENALADLILVKGDPIKDLSLITNPQDNFVVIIKNGVIYKNMLE